MKGIRLTTALILLISCGTLGARVKERSYVATDKDIYVAGERVWCSAFCFDAEQGTLSRVSSTIYLELFSDGKSVAGAKLALSGGRGGGFFRLPETLPTGNYTLVCYTAQNRAEQGYDYNGPAAKVLSVFNPFTRERGRVQVKEPSDYVVRSVSDDSAGGWTISVPAEAAPASWIKIDLTAAAEATFCLSVFREEGISHNPNPSLVTMLSSTTFGPSPATVFNPAVIPEYEGEIIRGRVVNVPPGQMEKVAGRSAWLSSPGTGADVYVAPVAPDGSITFFTGNIYGDRDLVTEIEGLDASLQCHIELSSPFTASGVAPADPLSLCPSFSEALTEMTASMQIERNFENDTLFDYLPVRPNLLPETGAVVYNLDDYTRFPTMAEVFVEYLSEISARRGGTELQVAIRQFRQVVAGNGRSLILLDGVPIFDHEKIYRYDPLLVKSIRVYPYRVVVGGRIFDGMADFITYRHSLPSMTFSDNLRVVKYRGVSYPVAHTAGFLPADGSYPDFRRTVYWHPLLEAAAGETISLNCRLPGQQGTYTVVLEGVTSEGKPVRETATFSVR